MAPLKFRAWDKQKNVMLEKPIVDEERGSLDYTFTQLAINFDGLVLGFSSHDWGKDGIHEHDVNVKDRFILMQSTGLLDKNGKEIFEGDVMFCKGSTLKGKYFTTITHDHKYEVKWKSEQAGFFEDGFNTLEYEVIGNIYENPELHTPTLNETSNSL